MEYGRVNTFRRSVSFLIFLALFSFLIILFYTPEPPLLEEYRIDILKKSHRPGLISDGNIRSLVQSIDMNELKKILKPILVQRIPGTSTHAQVKNFIVSEFQELKWTVELDTFQDVTPTKGKVPFSNIIVTHNSDSIRYLVLACHYDSKIFDGFKFIGATDSAVPCAMLIYLAKLLNNVLPNIESDVSLKFIFFDGEEAFKSWTEKDSLYGSRHLANVLRGKSLNVGSTSINDLDRMDLFVLLDLLGSPSPSFYSLFENSQRWYKLMVSTEKRLKTLGLLEPEVEKTNLKTYFLDRTFYGADIQDDHYPFLNDVAVLHVIPVPFPSVWHTKFDNESAINYHTVKNLLAIFEIFTFQYLSGSTSQT